MALIRYDGDRTATFHLRGPSGTIYHWSKGKEYYVLPQDVDSQLKWPGFAEVTVPDVPAAVPAEPTLQSAQAPSGPVGAPDGQDTAPAPPATEATTDASETAQEPTGATEGAETAATETAAADEGGVRLAAAVGVGLPGPQISGTGIVGAPPAEADSQAHGAAPADPSPWASLTINQRAALEAAGVTGGNVTEKTDEELLAIKGIGPGTVRLLRGE